MARTACIGDDELIKARKLRDQAESAMDLRKALSVLLVTEAGLETSMAAKTLGISERTLFRNRGDLRDQDKRPKGTWGGRRHCSMTIEEEREFLSQWESVATAGGVISVPPVHTALAKRLGRKIPPSTTYRLLARHGWRKVQPDTRHPKSDLAVQEEFKKKSRKSWGPPA